MTIVNSKFGIVNYRNRIVSNSSMVKIKNIPTEEKNDMQENTMKGGGMKNKGLKKLNRFISLKL
jgi:hypothetical protein